MGSPDSWPQRRNAPIVSTLVTGGAGYIGAHTVRQLRRRGDDVVVLDNLEQGTRAAIADTTLVIGDVGDGAVLEKLFKDHSIDAVIHLAARKSVDESLRHPAAYFRTNVGGSLGLIEACLQAGVQRMVFSSTCAVYGTPIELPVTETSAVHPETPYGESKLMVEQMLRWFDELLSMRSVSLRYFNAAGAAEEGDLGEDWDHAVNLVPVVMKALLGRGDPVRIFGTDYLTHDGTAIRDYVHVLDIADAHLRALDYLAAGGASQILNLGTGKGASVREVIAHAEQAAGIPVPVIEAPRREGDPPAIWAGGSRAHEQLGWHPHRGLDEIIASAWRWHSTHPDGYR